MQKRLVRPLQERFNKLFGLVKKGEERTFLLKGALYISFMAGASLLSVLKLPFFAGLLDPVALGTYSLVVTTCVYLTYAGSLGLNEGLLKLGAEARGRGDQKTIALLRDRSLWYGEWFLLVVCLFYLVALKLLLRDTELISSLSFAALLASATLAFNLADAYLRVINRYILFSLIVFFKAAAVLLFGYLIGREYGLRGVILGEIVGTIVVFLIFILSQRSGGGLHELTAKSGRLQVFFAMKCGFPLMLSALIRQVAISLDRWVIAASIGLAALGKYTLGMMVYLVIIAGSGFVTNVLGPKWLSGFAIHRSLLTLMTEIRRLAILMFVLGIILAFPLLYIFDFFARTYYLNYSGNNDLLFSAIYIYIGALVLVCTQLFDWFYVASSNESKLLKISTVMLAVTIALLLVLYFAEAGIVFYAGLFLFLRIMSGILYWFGISSIIPKHL